ncbi:MAG: energy-coupling factor transporter transmembrane component T family protein [Saccharofermentanales bacterium]|nr:energy-coupling factor transporter transmembrane protein EcfT [Clostridiaceae bacterium]
MFDNISLGRYYPGQSALHRLDPRTKLIAAIVIMVIVFLVRGLWPMLAIALLTGLLILASRVPVKIVLSGLKPMLLILIFAFLLNLLTVPGGKVWFAWGPLTVTEAGFLTAIRMTARLAFLIMNTTLMLTLTTTPIMVADATENLMAPLKKIRFPVHEMAMMMSIALRFVPTLLEETDKIMKAQSSRGADYDTGGLISKARGLVSVLIPLFVSSFKRAEDLAVAMEARCYRGGEGRTRLKSLAYTRLDLLFFAGLLGAGAVVLALEFALPATV